jgi:hypothetical protein
MSGYDTLLGQTRQKISWVEMLPEVRQRLRDFLSGPLGSTP